jgi:beta-glucanase (GH16 family)
MDGCRVDDLNVIASSRTRLAAAGAAMLAAAATVPEGSAPGAGTRSTVTARPAAQQRTWKRVFYDGFEHGFSASKWGRYSGQPGGDPGGWWDPSHVAVRRGILELRTYRDPRFGNRWVSGGVSSARSLTQRYGKYEVRFRMQSGKGVTGVLLLWPTADHWPPEIDFAEDGGTDGRRDSMTASLHYGSDNRQIQRTVHADFTRWHTIGVEWTPGRLAYTLDRRAWAVVRSRHVPAEKMELDMQTQAGTCGDRWAPCPDATTPQRVVMQVAWVAAYTRRG